jgi:hypothetical protein
MSEADKQIESNVISTEPIEAAVGQLDTVDLESVVGGLGIPPPQNVATTFSGSGLTIGGESPKQGLTGGDEPTQDIALNI